MAFESQSIKTISKRVLSDLKESLGDPRYFIGASPLQALAYAMSGVAYLLHTHIDQVADFKLLPDTAQGESLDRWATLFGITRNQATKSKGSITILGQKMEALASFNSVNSLDLIGSNGEKYKAQRVGGQFRCESLNTGAETELPSSEHLLFEKDPNSNVTISIDEPGILGGSNTESDEELRQRILLRLMHPPRGGTVDDYVRWVQEAMEDGAPFAGRVWIEPAYEKEGNVGVTFMTKNYKAPLPTESQNALVLAALNQRTPIGTTITVYPLLPKPIAFSLILKRLDKQVIVRDALERLFFDEALPGLTLFLSKINYTLAGALKGDEYVLVAPSSDLTFQKGECGAIGDFSCKEASHAIR